MIDVALRKTIEIDVHKLSNMLGVPVVPVNSKEGTGLNILKLQINFIIFQKNLEIKNFMI